MRTPWTNDELTLLQREYPDTPTWKLAICLNRSERSIYAKAKLCGLRKSREYMQSPDAGRLRPGNRKGLATQFKPGNRPHNYGRKGWSAGGDSVKTRFKAGNRPHTWVPVGSERITKEGLLQRKISDTGYSSRDWRSVHNIVWESAHGPTPSGHIVVFLDGDTKNIRIENLEAITRAENMRRNSIHHLPEAIADVCRIRGVLNRRINERAKRNEK